MGIYYVHIVTKIVKIPNYPLLFLCIFPILVSLHFICIPSPLVLKISNFMHKILGRKPKKNNVSSWGKITKSILLYMEFHPFKRQNSNLDLTQTYIYFRNCHIEPVNIKPYYVWNWSENWLKLQGHIFLNIPPPLPGRGKFFKTVSLGEGIKEMLKVSCLFWGCIIYIFLPKS